MFLEPWGLDLYFWRSFPPKNKVQTPTKTRVIKGFQVLLKKKIEDNNHQPTVTVTGNSGLLADVKAAASGAKAGLDKFWPKIFCRQNLVWICKKWWKIFWTPKKKIMQVHKCQTDSTHNQTNRTPDVIMILHEHLSWKSVQKKHKDPRSAGNNNRNPTTEGPFNYQKNVLMMFPPVFFGHVFKMDMFREWNPGEKSTKPLKRFVYGEKSTKPPLGFPQLL